MNLATSHFAMPLGFVLALTTATVVAAALPQGRGAPPADKGRGAAPADKGRGAAAEDDLSSIYFEAADWDKDGMIRFSEAEKSMGVERSEFALFDTDRDGVIVLAEFAKRYLKITERGGVFTAPRAKPDAPRAAKKDGKALLLAYDDDLDGMLTESEVDRALDAARIDDPSPLVIVTTFDRDRSGGIDHGELEEFSSMLHPDPRSSRAKKSMTLAELFDRTKADDARTGSTIGPRRTPGPIPVFQRLDYDRSGGIGLQDLEDLNRPLSSAVRPAVVLATLDTDADGVISREEFATSMR